MNGGGIELVCQCAHSFRSYEDAATKAYGHTGALLNMKYLNDCLITLCNIIMHGRGGPHKKSSFNHYITAFKEGSLHDLQIVAEILLNELKESPYKFVWSIAAEDNVFFL